MRCLIHGKTRMTRGKDERKVYSIYWHIIIIIGDASINKSHYTHIYKGF